MKLPKLPEFLEISSGWRKQVAAAGRPGQQQEGNRKDNMDWLLGLLIPLKWAVVLVIIYFVLTAIF